MTFADLPEALAWLDGHIDFVTTAGEHHDGKLTIDRIVLDQEDAIVGLIVGRNSL